ncbi:hypothetical protein SMD44_03643 [Streptomyces alboflavus]|uniref:Uncharacterized protein n=1 Tax=Streptomyces alboflavus TaxID=67267 RepID=A0A1Z1WCM0_9ACTN|nr:hypothetical protein SMD44_03643 [Streptomyces alboflavus]
MRISPSGKRRASALTPTVDPAGSDWMWTAKPMAVRDSSWCWERWLPTTV